MTYKPRGILRNAHTAAPTSVKNDVDEPFDRTRVLENTKANAKLNAVGSAIQATSAGPSHTDSSTSPGLSRSSGSVSNGNESHIIDPSKLPDPDRLDPDHLRWDETNLYLTEQEKNATMKITEPKTPYQGAVGDSEYYKPDEDEEIELNPPVAAALNIDSIDDFSLGEAAEPEIADPTVENNRIYVDPTIEPQEVEDDQDEEDEEETPEQKKKRFEEMRKAHYHMKGTVLHDLKKKFDEEEE